MAARSLLETASDGVLATLEGDGHPYASIVELMPWGNQIVLFLSNLAVHTKNQASDARVSVVVRRDAADELLAGPRATFQGTISKLERSDALAEAWVERHPGAANYIGFADFNFYAVHVDRVRYIEGFGRMGWIHAMEWSAAEPDPLCGFARGVIEHMNEDHAHNLLDYVHAFTDHDWPEKAIMTDLDRDGFGIFASSDDRTETVRIGFAKSMETRDAVHEVMVRLARLARQELG